MRFHRNGAPPRGAPLRAAGASPNPVRLEYPNPKPLSNRTDFRTACRSIRFSWHGCCCSRHFHIGGFQTSQNQFGWAAFAVACEVKSLCFFRRPPLRLLVHRLARTRAGRGRIFSAPSIPRAMTSNPRPPGAASADAFTLLHDKNMLAPASASSWCPTMDLLALATSDGQLSLARLDWNKPPSERENKLWTSNPDSPVTSLGWRPDGKVLVSGHADGTVQLHHVEDGEVLHVSRPHDAAVTCVHWQEAPASDAFRSSCAHQTAAARFTLPGRHRDSRERDRDRRSSRFSRDDDPDRALLDHFNPTSRLTVLCTGDARGVIALSAFGVFSVARANLSASDVRAGDGAAFPPGTRFRREHVLRVPEPLARPRRVRGPKTRRARDIDGARRRRRKGRFIFRSVRHHRGRVASRRARSGPVRDRVAGLARGDAAEDADATLSPPPLRDVAQGARRFPRKDANPPSSSPRVGRRRRRRCPRRRWRIIFSRSSPPRIIFFKVRRNDWRSFSRTSSAVPRCVARPSPWTPPRPPCTPPSWIASSPRRSRRRCASLAELRDDVALARLPPPPVDWTKNARRRRAGGGTRVSRRIDGDARRHGRRRASSRVFRPPPSNAARARRGEPGRRRGGTERVTRRERRARARVSRRRRRRGPARRRTLRRERNDDGRKRARRGRGRGRGRKRPREETLRPKIS